MGKAIIQVGGKQAEGDIAGMTIAELRREVVKLLPDETRLPAAPAVVFTMDPEREEWKNQPAPETDAMMGQKTDRGARLMQGLTKQVTDDYTIGPDDLAITFKVED